MPESRFAFVEVRKWVADVAASDGVRLSSRHAKAVARQWITQAECDLDGESTDIRLHSDPTGEAAVRNVLALIRQAQEAAADAA